MCNILDLLLQHPYETLQHTSETSETLETYTCNMHFHRNISLLRSRIAAAIASTGGTTFWWGTTSSVAPRQHPSRTSARGHGALCAAAGARRVASWSGRGGGWSVAWQWRGRSAGYSAALDGGAARREMGCAVGKTAAASARHNSTRWVRAMGRYF